MPEICDWLDGEMVSHKILKMGSDCRLMGLPFPQLTRGDLPITEWGARAPTALFGKLRLKNDGHYGEYVFFQPDQFLFLFVKWLFDAVIRYSFDSSNEKDEGLFRYTIYSIHIITS